MVYGTQTSLLHSIKHTIFILCIQMSRGSYVSPDSTRGPREESLDHLH